MEHVTDSVKKVLLAGVGAAALTAEKAQKLADEFVKKGESIVKEGRSSNEELKRDVKSKVKAKVKDTLHLEEDYSDEESVEQILKNLTAEERKIIRETMEKIETEEAQTDYKEVKDPNEGSQKDDPESADQKVSKEEEQKAE